MLKVSRIFKVAEEHARIDTFPEAINPKAEFEENPDKKGSKDIIEFIF